MKLSFLTAAVAFACLAASPNIDKNKAFGVSSAPVMMEVFSSFDCTHCRDFYQQLVPSLMKDYVIPGKVYLVNREFPLAGHVQAREAANYATAAARIGKYHQVADALFLNQGAWSRTGEVWPFVAGVLTAPERAKVQTLAKDPEVVSEVQRDVDAAMAQSVDRTPTLIITAGVRRFPIPGSPPYDLLKNFLNALIR